ncbi:hypothetical protein PAAG_11607 [Paracoccidioides lutzii Pb01]|uniref:Uncharacterized protein n=1 Tax=Paracoccidioides lutzii (strain ATCC MYA-826 / Pb01) TaxID=502779 RepID=A0A0A2V6B3_PARBA|nr:hypothetical protein PAAG_11607 [Paracoccidioides lutzii Pb01]KGQ01625.1 hypothetical protein PAAG_11607 [Paracoccidioides lutzii Pb01]
MPRAMAFSSALPVTSWVDGYGGVDAAAFAEEGADGAAGAFGGDEDYVDVGGDVNLREVFEDGGEAVGEVEARRRCRASHVQPHAASDSAKNRSFGDQPDDTTCVNAAMSNPNRHIAITSSSLHSAKKGAPTAASAATDAPGEPPQPLNNAPQDATSTHNIILSGPA